MFSQASRRSARTGREISSRGSFGAPATWNAGGRAARARTLCAGFATARFFAAGRTAVACLATFGGASGSLPAAGFFAGALTAFATSVAVPTYGERSSGEPVSAYEPRASLSVIVGAPVSCRRVPGAGSCAATWFVA